LDSFATALIDQGVYSQTEYGKTCFYGRAYIVAGSQLTASDALDQYVEALQIQDWRLKEKTYQDSKTLLLGSNSLIVVYYGEPWPVFKKDIDLERLYQIYQSILFIRVDYMLPTRDEC
jgi:hypothetical protein